jgi:DNA adenine methylase
MMTPSPIKFFGGKSYISNKIRATFPPHLNYVEPYAGGLSVLLSGDGEGVSEVANDINPQLQNFWAVMSDQEQFALFRRFAEATPFSEVCWQSANKWKDATVLQPYQKAWTFFVRSRMSMAGRMKNFAPTSKARTRRNMNEQVSAWISAVDGLPEVYHRLRRVLILNREALDVIEEYDLVNTLIYIDCPYLPETRTSPDVYDFEMTVEQHEDLLRRIVKCNAMVAISGYPSVLYNEALKDWHRIEFDVANHSSGKSTKRRMTEVLWTNYVPVSDSTMP